MYNDVRETGRNITERSFDFTVKPSHPPLEIVRCSLGVQI
jgi:hypothetical protein